MAQKYMLDTDICSYIIRDNPKELAEKFLLHKENISISVIVCAELMFGIRKKSSTKLSKRVEQFLYLSKKIDFSEAAAKQYAIIRAECESKGTPLDDMDLMIAATAMVENAVLVSNNKKHFEKIKGLKVQSWIRVL